MGSAHLLSAGGYGATAVSSLSTQSTHPGASRRGCWCKLKSLITLVLQNNFLPQGILEIPPKTWGALLLYKEYVCKVDNFQMSNGFSDLAITIHYSGFSTSAGHVVSLGIFRIHGQANDTFKQGKNKQPNRQRAPHQVCPNTFSHHCSIG